MKRVLTIDDVARQAGVSRSTVSLVLRDSPLVAQDTRDAVRQAIARIGYVYNRKAAIRSRLSYLVGIVVPDLGNPFFASLAAGIDAALNESGWVSLIGDSAESVDKQAVIVRRMQEQMIDGMLICPAAQSPGKLIDQLAAAGGITVQMMRHADQRPTNYIGIDYAQGVRLAVEHLHGLGHSRIAFLGTAAAHSAMAERHRGYRSAMAEHGLAERYVGCELTRTGAATAIEAVFAGSDPPTAFVCFNDVVAIGAIAGLDRVGRTVGHDVSVIGFDNIPGAAFTRPGLTTIDSDAHQLGHEAATILLAGIRTGQLPAVNASMPTRLVVRGTTASPLG